MMKSRIDFDGIQKAMEDAERNAFDYFIDKETGEVIILSEDIIQKAQDLLDRSYDDDMSDFEEVEVDKEPEIPEWMEDEIELALDIFIDDKDRYIRIPERDPKDTYTVMQSFINTLEHGELRQELSAALDGQGAFRRFKDALATYPKERKLWHGFNAKAARRMIADWLESMAIPLTPSHLTSHQTKFDN